MTGPIETTKLSPKTNTATTLHPLSVQPTLEMPTTGCLGFAIVDLAQTMDATNLRSVSVATQICQMFLNNLQGFSVDHLKKLEERASLLQGSRLWSGVLSLCSFVGSALSLFAGMSSSNPVMSVAAAGLGLAPFIYNALSSSLEHKDLKKEATQFGVLLGTALLFVYFKAEIPNLNLQAIFQSSINIAQTMSGVVQGIYSARLTWKEGELGTLQFLTKTIQDKLQEMTGSLTENIKNVATNVSFLNDVLSQYLETKTNLITR